MIDKNNGEVRTSPEEKTNSEKRQEDQNIDKNTEEERNREANKDNLIASKIIPNIEKQEILEERKGETYYKTKDIVSLIDRDEVGSTSKGKLSKSTVVKILSDVIIKRATTTETSSATPKISRKRNYTSSVLTSDIWYENELKKKQDKEEEEKKKEERKRLRTINAQKKREERNQQKHRSRNHKILKKVKVNNTMIGVDKNKDIESLQKTKDLIIGEDDIEESMDNKDTVPIQMNNLKKGMYVIVEYLDSFYPGKILNISKDSVQVQTMERSGLLWKWPEREETLFYNVEDIKEVIKTPQKKNTRGSYSVSEMEKFLDFSFK